MPGTELSKGNGGSAHRPVDVFGARIFSDNGKRYTVAMRPDAVNAEKRIEIKKA